MPTRTQINQLIDIEKSQKATEKVQTEQAKAAVKENARISKKLLGKSKAGIAEVVSKSLEWESEREKRKAERTEEKIQAAFGSPMSQEEIDESVDQMVKESQWGEKPNKPLNLKDIKKPLFHFKDPGNGFQIIS